MARPCRFVLAATAAVLACAAPVAAWAVVPEGPPSEDADTFDGAAMYRDAVTAIDAGRFADAQKLLLQLIARTPQDANAQFMLGKADEGLGDMPHAKAAFQAATRLDPNNLRAWAELGVVQVKSSDAAAAKSTLDDLKKRAAACGAQCADSAASVTRLQTAIAGGPSAALDTGHALLFASSAAGDRAYLSAVTLINQHRYEQALVSLHAAEVAFGPHPDVLTYIGFVNRKLGRYDLAEQYYRRALAAAPQHRGAAEYYGELKVVRGDMAGARVMLARLETLCTFGCAEADELKRWIDGTHTGS